MKRTNRNMVVVAAILGMVWQAQGQSQNDAIRWQIVDGTQTTNQRIKAHARRSNIQLKLRDPAAEYKKIESQLERARRTTGSSAKGQRQRQTAARPLSIPQALTQRLPQNSKGTVRHPATVVGRNSRVEHPSSLVAPRRIQLVQAEEGETDVEDLLKDLDSLIDQGDTSEESIEELMQQAKDLVDKQQNTDSAPSLLDSADSPGVDPSDSGDSLDLDELDAPNPAEDSQSPEEMRDKLKRELDRLLDDEDAIDDEDPLGLTGDGDDEDDDELKAKEAEEEEYIQSLVDPVPDAAYRNRRARQVNMPYTLSNILGEEDRYDPSCVQEYCRQMWECAGGRCLSPLDRLRRNINRDRTVRNAGCGPKPCSPMKNFRCPKCPNIQPQAMGGGYVPAQTSPCPPGELPNAEFQPFDGTIGPDGTVTESPEPSALPEMEAPVEKAPLGLLEPVEPLPADEQ